MKYVSIAAVAVVTLTISGAHAQRTESRTMRFDLCLELIRNTATRLGVAPVNIVETSILRMVRFPTIDGSVLVTCSAPDEKVLIQETANECGVDVNC